MSVIGLLAATLVSLPPTPASQVYSPVSSQGSCKTRITSFYDLLRALCDFPSYSELSLIWNSLQESTLTPNTPLISYPDVPEGSGKTQLQGLRSCYCMHLEHSFLNVFKTCYFLDGDLNITFAWGLILANLFKTIKQKHTTYMQVLPIHFLAQVLLFKYLLTPKVPYLLFTYPHVSFKRTEMFGVFLLLYYQSHNGVWHKEAQIAPQIFVVVNERYKYIWSKQ